MSDVPSHMMAHGMRGEQSMADDDASGEVKPASASPMDVATAAAAADTVGGAAGAHMASERHARISGKAKAVGQASTTETVPHIPLDPKTEAILDQIEKEEKEPKPPIDAALDMSALPGERGKKRMRPENIRNHFNNPMRKYNGAVLNFFDHRCEATLYDLQAMADLVWGRTLSLPEVLDIALFGDPCRVSTWTYIERGGVQHGDWPINQKLEQDLDPLRSTSCCSARALRRKGGAPPWPSTMTTSLSLTTTSRPTIIFAARTMPQPRLRMPICRSWPASTLCSPASPRHAL